MIDYTYQLQMIHWLQGFRSPALDAFFYFLNFIDSPYFIFLLFPALWLGVSWRLGVRVFFLICISGIVNYSLKQLFQEPRPFVLEPGLNLVSMKSQYGLPSGAAQSAVIYAGLIIEAFRTPLAWVAACLVFFFLSISRIYLGLHFPSDLALGWLVGGVLVWAYFAFYPKIERAIAKMPLSGRFWLSQIIPLVVLAIVYPLGVKTTERIALSFLAVGWGLTLAAWQGVLLPPSKSVPQGIFRFLVGAAGIYTINYFHDFPVLTALLSGFWLSYLAGRLILLVENSRYLPAKW